MPALRPGLTRRAAPPDRAGRRRIQYGYRLLGVSDTDAASGSEPTKFRSLGDAIDRTGGPDRPAMIDLGPGAAPRFYSYREVDLICIRDGDGSFRKSRWTGPKRVARLRTRQF